MDGQTPGVGSKMGRRLHPMVLAKQTRTLYALWRKSRKLCHTKTISETIGERPDQVNFEILHYEKINSEKSF